MRKIVFIQTIGMNGMFYLFRENLVSNDKVTLIIKDCPQGAYITSILAESQNLNKLILVQ